MLTGQALSIASSMGVVCRWNSHNRANQLLVFKPLTDVAWPVAIFSSREPEKRDHRVVDGSCRVIWLILPSREGRGISPKRDLV
jgi:hypothetical protein